MFWFAGAVFEANFRSKSSEANFHFVVYSDHQRVVVTQFSRKVASIPVSVNSVTSVRSEKENFHSNHTTSTLKKPRPTTTPHRFGSDFDFFRIIRQTTTQRK